MGAASYAGCVDSCIIVVLVFPLLNHGNCFFTSRQDPTCTTNIPKKASAAAAMGR